MNKDKIQNFCKKRGVEISTYYDHRLMIIIIKMRKMGCLVTWHVGEKDVLPTGVNPVVEWTLVRMADRLDCMIAAAEHIFNESDIKKSKKERMKFIE